MKRVPNTNPKHTRAWKQRHKKVAPAREKPSDPLYDAADAMEAALFALGEDSNWVEVTTPNGVTVVAAYDDAGEALAKWVKKKFGGA